MDPLIVSLNGVFDDAFPGSSHPLDSVLPDSPRVGGFIVWEGFDEMTQRARQHNVWNVIRQNVDVQGQQRITAILTLTPLEEQAILENE